MDGGTSGAIVNPAGLTVSVSDAPAPDGVRITVTGSGSAKASFTVCGSFSLKLAAGSNAVLTCGSVKVQVVSGSAEVELAGGATVVSVPAGVTAKVSDTGGGGFSVENLGGGTVTVTTNGTASTVAPGQTVSVDTAPPVITPTVVGTLGQNGWHRSNVSVSWTVTDAQSTVTSQTGCGPSSVTTDTTGVTKTCTAVSAGGSNSQSVMIKRDATPPLVSYAAHAASYTVDQTVSINCTATDATSGIQSGCQPINAPAYSFPLGPNTRTTSATDNAGNTRTASTGFTVKVTAASLCTLTRQFVHGSAKYQAATNTQRAAVDLVVTAGCLALNARQIGLYKTAVTGLANTGWLTTQQRTTLRALADRL